MYKQYYISFTKTMNGGAAVVVKEYRNNEGGVIRIHDDYIVSKEEQEIIIKRMTERIQRCLVARMISEEETA